MCVNDAFWPRILMFNLLASPSCLSVSACSPPHPPQPSLASHRHRRDRSQKFWSTNSPILVLPPGCPGVQNWTARDRKKKKYYIVHTRMLRIKARRNYLPFLLLSSHKRAVGSFFFFFGLGFGQLLEALPLHPSYSFSRTVSNLMKA